MHDNHVTGKQKMSCLLYGLRSVLNGVVLCVYPQSPDVADIKQWWSGGRER